jgi:hypothetical protein
LGVLAKRLLTWGFEEVVACAGAAQRLGWKRHGSVCVRNRARCGDRRSRASAPPRPEPVVSATSVRIEIESARFPSPGSAPAGGAVGSPHPSPGPPRPSTRCWPDEALDSEPGDEGRFWRIDDGTWARVTPPPWGGPGRFRSPFVAVTARTAACPSSPKQASAEAVEGWKRSSADASFPSAGGKSALRPRCS